MVGLGGLLSIFFLSLFRLLYKLSCTGTGGRLDRNFITRIVSICLLDFGISFL